MRDWEGSQEGSETPSEEGLVRMGIWLAEDAALHFFQEDPPGEPEGRPQRPKSFQQKRDYFQKMGEDVQGGSHGEI